MHTVLCEERGAHSFPDAVIGYERGSRDMVKEKGRVRLVKDGDRQAELHRTFETAVDLPDATREAMIGLLNQQLADTADISSQTKQAHWNVKGLEFFQLHELFDEMAAEVLAHTD